MCLATTADSARLGGVAFERKSLSWVVFPAAAELRHPKSLTRVCSIILAVVLCNTK